MGLLDSALAKSVGFMPRALVRRVALKYVAGERLEDAVSEVRKLNLAGCTATIDLLGESISNRQAAVASADTYLTVIDAIVEKKLDANVSVKPTHFGLAFDPELFLHNARRVARKAAENNVFVRIDMEDSPFTTATLDGYRKLRAEGFENLGVVLQAMLRRTPTDLRSLAELEPKIRLCKGVYREAADVAWQTREDVNRAYLDLLREALPDPRYKMAIATHDDALVEGAERLIRQHGLSRDRYEFQMLLGVKPELRKDLVSRGHRVRLYVPFGLDWYAYSIRRLRENPKFAGYITLDVLKDPKSLLGDPSAGR
jgi:proline dehydrogenase